MIQELKQEIRTRIKNERRSLSDNIKELLDNKISDNLIKSGLLDKSKIVLVYLSTEIEVDTKKIINYCLQNNIRIAVPRCFGERKMNFYYYDSNIKLEKSKFGIYEPADNDDNKVTSFVNALCVVPALSYDKAGYRLGYGGGYYDTFLADNPDVKTVGICYSQHISDILPVDKFDKNVNYLITENKMEVCNGYTT